MLPLWITNVQSLVIWRDAKDYIHKGTIDELNRWEKLEERAKKIEKIKEKLKNGIKHQRR